MPAAKLSCPQCGNADRERMSYTCQLTHDGRARMVSCDICWCEYAEDYQLEFADVYRTDGMGET